MKRALSILLCLALALSLGVGAFASGEASGGGGGALPSGGSFGDVKTGVVNNTVVFVDGSGLTANADAADIYEVADGGAVTADSVTGLYIRNASVHNSVNDAGGTTQGISGVTFVDTDGMFGGVNGYYAVDEGGDPLSATL